MKLWMLGSGSRGNAVLLECAGGSVLVDAGFGTRTLARRLASAGTAPDSIAGVVITHEHGDHVRGAGAATAKWGWPVHATAGTRDASPPLAGYGVVTFSAGDTFAVGGCDVETIRVSHDAADPVGLVITERATGVRAGILYDLGDFTSEICRALALVDILVMEANHDSGMLRAGPYPPSVQKRISGRRGHLSNAAAGEAARECIHRGLGDVVLAHISEKCNTPELARDTVWASLTRRSFRGRLHMAAQDTVCGPFGAGASASRATVQLGLGL
jgi:phosphoribosyl 1,2-cyclic phosphodiesterase